jgi:hypothetical protein
MAKLKLLIVDEAGNTQKVTDDVLKFFYMPASEEEWQRVEAMDIELFDQDDLVHDIECTLVHMGMLEGR